MNQLSLDIGLKTKKKEQVVEPHGGMGRLEHLVVHSGVASSGSCSCRGSLSTVADHSISAALGGGEVIGHLSVELFDRLLLLALATTTATTASAASGLATCLTGNGGSLGSGRRLGLILLRLSNVVSRCSNT